MSVMTKFDEDFIDSHFKSVELEDRVESLLKINAELEKEISELKRQIKANSKSGQSS